MAYSAIAYGATGLNYYCWNGGVYWAARFPNENTSMPGRPGPMYQTVREINADAASWGDEMLANGFGFAGALHTGFDDGSNGGGVPSAEAVVTSMSDDLLVGVFVPSEARGRGAQAASEAHTNGGSKHWSDEAAPAASTPTAYLFVVSKAVSGAVAPVAARNITLTLHPSVSAASVAAPGAQGARGFAELYAKHGLSPPPAGPRLPSRC